MWSRPSATIVPSNTKMLQCPGFDSTWVHLFTRTTLQDKRELATTWDVHRKWQFTWSAFRNMMLRSVPMICDTCWQSDPSLLVSAPTASASKKAMSCNHRKFSLIWFERTTCIIQLETCYLSFCPIQPWTTHHFKPTLMREGLKLVTSN